MSDETYRRPLLWGNLLHLSYNMWSDRDYPDAREHTVMRDHVRFDRGLWDDITQKMADVGMNLLVIDLGDGVLWDSHTEITVEGAWSRDEMKQELARLRGLGLEPIPKLNFSTAHDAWLKEYSRMVSTPKYYEVCSHLVEEVVDLFDTPRLFHLGMDEETAHHQRHFAYAVMRQHELWWHDLHFLVGEVEKHDARPWVWSDYVWLHPGEFFREMPKSVLQSNWYYAEAFDDLENEPEGRRSAVETYRSLEEHGYDQIPTGSNWLNDVNFERTVAYCREHVAPERLLGFLTAPWSPTLEARRLNHLAAVDQVAETMNQAE